MSCQTSRAPWSGLHRHTALSFLAHTHLLKSQISLHAPRTTQGASTSRGRRSTSGTTWQCPEQHIRSPAGPLPSLSPRGTAQNSTYRSVWSQSRAPKLAAVGMEKSVLHLLATFHRLLISSTHTSSHQHLLASPSAYSRAPQQLQRCLVSTRPNGACALPTRAPRGGSPLMCQTLVDVYCGDRFTQCHDPCLQVCTRRLSRCALGRDKHLGLYRRVRRSQLVCPGSKSAKQMRL